MLFYKINATYADKKWGEQNDDRRVREERARWISKKTKNFNDRNEEKFYGFISELERDEIICGIFLSISIDVIKLAKSFFKLLGIAVKDFEASETTFYSMRNLLGRACNNHFIENDREKPLTKIATP